MECIAKMEKWIALIVVSTAILSSSRSAHAHIRDRHWPKNYFTKNQEEKNYRATVLQYLLRAWGYTLTVSNRFDEPTKLALKQFQQSQKLEVSEEKMPWELLAVTLTMGNENEAVKSLQVLLRERGYDVAMDGKFNNRIKMFVLKFQNNANLFGYLADPPPELGRYVTPDRYYLTPYGTVVPLRKDGIVDSDTWAALMAGRYWEVMYGDVVDRKGEDNEDVSVAVRGLLLTHGFTVKAGIFEEQVTITLRQFQTTNGLIPTGRMNDATWEALVIDVNANSKREEVYALQDYINSATSLKVKRTGRFDDQTRSALQELSWPKEKKKPESISKRWWFDRMRYLYESHLPPPWGS